MAAVRRSGQVAILRFPQVDLALGKPRPVLLVAPVPGGYDDWLVCMLSTQLQQAVPGFDEIVGPDQDDFGLSGLKAASVIRVGRLAVVSADVLLGAIGEVGQERMRRVRRNLAEWIRNS